MRRVQGRAELSVLYRGPGVPHGELTRIFERYVSLRSSPRPARATARAAPTWASACGSCVATYRRLAAACARKTVLTAAWPWCCAFPWRDEALTGSVRLTSPGLQPSLRRIPATYPICSGTPPQLRPTRRLRPVVSRSEERLVGNGWVSTSKICRSQ